jgi:hypothetical protein
MTPAYAKYRAHLEAFGSDSVTSMEDPLVIDPPEEDDPDPVASIDYRNPPNPKSLTYEYVDFSVFAMFLFCGKSLIVCAFSPLSTSSQSVEKNS